MKRTLLCCLLLATATAFAARPREPSGPNHDLTKEIDFERMSTFHLGPTGARGWMYVKRLMTHEARQILVTEVDAGSPSEGVLEEGDVILGVGGKPFDSDARKCLGAAIDEAEKEENKGILQLTRWRPVKDATPRQGKVEEVKITLPVMGGYSTTAPYDCPKSATIRDEALRHVIAGAAKKDFGKLGECALALMAVGGPDHMRMVREYLHEAKWAKPDFEISLESGGLVCWGYGIHTLIMTEYYLATGDEYVLPAIREHAVKIAMGQSSGGLWGHGFAWTSKNDGRLHGSLGGYGALNLAGLPCLLSMILARKCGVEHPEIDAAIERACRFFREFVGRGTIGYGYHRPSLDHYNNGRNGFSSNGKNAIAGLVFSVLGEGEVSNYYAKLITSSYDEREYGHAGNSFNVFWGMLGANCGGPRAAAAFHRETRWYNALTRKGDGSVNFQQLGGYYGGATLDLAAAHVLANAVPLRKLYITGREPNRSLWLDEAQVKEAVDAGRWHWADYDAMSVDELVAALDCWSPGAREWIAKALGEKAGDSVAPLLKALGSDSAHLRAGACTAFGYQRERAASAVPALVKALSDKESTVRVAASYALMRVGAPARNAIPDMFKAVVTTEEEGPLQATLQAMSFSLGSDGAGTAPLYFTGILASTPEGENPLDGMDRDILYPAIARLSRSRSGRIRGCGVYAFKYFNREDIKMMAQEIYDVTASKAPDFVMFAERPRCHGMDLMARFDITDGVKLCADSLIGGGWGGFWREPHHFHTLQAYGRLARSELTRLKAARWSRRDGEKRAILEETIRAIESDEREVNPVSLLDLVGERVETELTAVDGNRACAALCRELITRDPEDHLQHAVALRKLVAMRGSGAFGDILSGLESPGEFVRAEAVALGSELEGFCMGWRWRRALRNAESAQKAGVFRVLAARGDRKVLDDAIQCLAHEDEAVQIAAIKLAGELGGLDEAAILAVLLGKGFEGEVRAAMEAAVAAICRTTAGEGWALRLVVEMLASADDAQRVSLARTLGNIGSSEALRAIIPVLADKNREARSVAAEILGGSKEPGVTAMLFAAAGETEDKGLKVEIARTCLRRVVVEVAPGEGRLPVLQQTMALTDNRSIITEALAELQWMPSPAALRLAQSWADRTGEGTTAVAIAESASAAVVAIREALATSGSKAGE
jgi:HEAT repeat protein